MIEKPARDHESLEEIMDELTARLAHSVELREELLQHSDRRIAELEGARDSLQRELDAARSSTSWRLTAPLRAVGDALYRLKRRPRP